MDNYEKLAEMIKNSKHIAFFGGAGVSTSSGLKDYRSKDGIYNAVNKYGFPPETLLSHDFLIHHSKAFYEFFREYFFGTPKPSAPHLALKKLEDMGYDVKIITQNIDGLHTKAGSSTVYELHGNASRFYCADCLKKYTKDEVIAFGDNVPVCGKCGGLIRPDVIMYGESLVNFNLVMARDAIEKADTLIVGGTSLSVWPAASMVDFYTGDNLVVINREPTAADRRANLVFHENIGDVLTKAIALIK